ncbi:hypothetical protein VMCG_07766 [Cytospora schulzeri]|uniref:Uncharacterized protein n=1 Tax=Cytospora schulzeri TaxID=448051 RepID=A0A423VZR3_9PEZI|nr:hypothetical protein VMCG_07766 [Valsa malicola]
MVEHSFSDSGDNDDCVLITPTRAPRRLPADHSLINEESSLSSGNHHKLHSAPLANGEASASYTPIDQPSLREIATQALNLSEPLAQSRHNHQPPVSTENHEMDLRPMSLAADKETGEIDIVDDSDEESPARSMTMTPEWDLEDNPSILPSVEGPQLPSDDLAKLIAEKAPELLPNLDTIRNLFEEAYAKQTAAPQADRSIFLQPLTWPVRRRWPTVDGNANAPFFGLNQMAPSTSHFWEEVTHRGLYPGTSHFEGQSFAVGGRHTGSLASRMRLPEVTRNRFKETDGSSVSSPTFRFRLPEPASGHDIFRIPEEVLPPENTAPLLAYQPEINMEPAAKRRKLDAAESSMGQNSGSVPAPSSPPARQHLSDLLDEPDLPSEFYKMRLLELRARLKDDEERLPHINNHNEARDKELQILLLRTDVEKQRLLLKAQLAYEEATDGEEQVVLNLTYPFPTPGSDNRYGCLPRSSVFMLRALIKLKDELKVLETELEGNKGEEDNEAAAEKTIRMENLRFFIEKFTGFYNADLEKEEKVRRKRDELERQSSLLADGSAAQPSKTSPPIRYPTQMIHDSPKTPPHPDTGVQSPPAEHSIPAAIPVPSPRPLEDSDVSPRDNSGRRLPRLPRINSYQPRPDMVEEDTPSDSDVSM